MNAGQLLFRIVVVFGVAFVVGTPSHAQFTAEPSENGSRKSVGLSTGDSTVAGRTHEPATVSSAPALLCQCIGEGESQTVKKIEQALRSPLHPAGLNLVEVNLRDVFEALQDEYQIPIHLDIVALEEIGLNSDEIVTINVRDVSLRSGLRLLLHDLQLTYVIENEVLMITTPQKAEENFKTCVYNVSDLIDARNEKEDIAALIDVLKMSLPEPSTDRNESTDIKPLKSGLLVIKQASAAHAQISELLAAIRKMRAAPAPARGAEIKP